MKTKSFHELKSGDRVHAWGTVLTVLESWREPRDPSECEGGERTLVRWVEDAPPAGEKYKTYRWPWTSGLSVAYARNYQLEEK